MKTMPILRLLLLAKKHPIYSGKVCYAKKCNRSQHHFQFTKMVKLFHSHSLCFEVQCAREEHNAKYDNPSPQHGQGDGLQLKFFAIYVNAAISFDQSLNREFEDTASIFLVVAINDIV